MAYNVYGGGANGDYGLLTRRANVSSPIQTITLGTNWSTVSCVKSDYRVAAIKKDGTLWLWASNYGGSLGNNSSVPIDSPVQVITYTNDWSKISCGDRHTAALKNDGTLWLWGNNNSGQLGTNNITSRNSPVQVITGGSNWSAISCGNVHTAAIKTDGSLWCWGSASAYGQLGDNTTVTKSSPVQTVTYTTDWSQVACGDDHTAAIKTDGTLWLWGRNSYGQLGDNTVISKSSPVQTVAGGSTWNKIACGASHTAAIKTDGTLWVWGRNSNGQLGDNTTTRKSSPIQTIAVGTNWSSVSCGNDNTAAIKTDGTLWLWGGNSYGQLGDNTKTSRSSPVQTTTYGTDWSVVSLGQSYTSGIKSDGTLWMWGRAYYGVLGGGNYFVDLQDMNFGEYISEISAGNHAAIIKKDGTLWLWGDNSNGQLGDNTILNEISPVQTVTVGENWSKVSCGYYHTAALKTDGTLWTWGRNADGQLGDNTIVHRSSPVQTVTYTTDWSQVACGYYHTAALKTDGTLWTWGRNAFGQLGDNTAGTYKSSPVQTVAGGTNWSSISCGRDHMTAIKKDGTLWTWGYGLLLGDNSSINKSSPVQTIAGGTNWSSVDCGANHTAAIKTDGTLWLWGLNSYGQLGDNTIFQKSSPVQTLVGGTNWSQVSGGAILTAAIKTDGTVWTWGRNTLKELNNGTIAITRSPRRINTLGKKWSIVIAFSTGIFSLVENLIYLPIIPKRSEVSGNVPTSGQLNIGELAVNISDKKGYIKKSDGTVLNIFNGSVYDGGTF